MASTSDIEPGFRPDLRKDVWSYLVDLENNAAPPPSLAELVVIALVFSSRPLTRKETLAWIMVNVTSFRPFV
jgi:hypothetical protein